MMRGISFKRMRLYLFFFISLAFVLVRATPVVVIPQAVHASPTATLAIQFVAVPRFTPPPTPRPPTTPVLCATLHQKWSRADWPVVINTLLMLHQRKAECGNGDPYLQLYPAYYNQGVALRAKGDLAGAITAYRKALAVQPVGKEAIKALRDLNAFIPAPGVACPQNSPSLAPYQSISTQSGPFITLSGGRFALMGRTFTLRGVNYYPSTSPWRRFIPHMDGAITTKDLDLFVAAGLNSIRIFVRNNAMFICDGTVPDQAAFDRVDQLLQMAAMRGLKVLFTLNDLPDLYNRPLYTDPAVANAQSLFIMARYRDERAILAWDIRNEPDVDWIRGEATSTDVMAWARGFLPRARAAAPHHLITIGTNEHAFMFIGLVDFLSIHHWHSGADLTSRLTALRGQTDMPILVQEVGYASPAETVSRQANNLQEALSVAEGQNTLGWMVWTAFDFPTWATCIPPACPSADNSEHHFGLWRVDYSPKPALAVIKTFTRH
jgi:Cellulase (glycosyl hydrolase family 5)